jgi:molybdopterin/thiamine biosynthesis adenylyltransferase/molybdopterin synthase catalytic subunit/rhodanese-related sulfurtransferase
MEFQLFDRELPENLLGDSPSSGAKAVFVGQVRDVNEGRPVLSLEYEAFDELAVKEGESILRQAKSLFPIEDAGCAHRTGHLKIGDSAIRVEVLSRHRKEAFEACRWIVDEVKSRVPIWKREHYVDGATEWVDPRKAQLVESELYERQTRLKEVGVAGQEKLKQAKVLVIGAGGLGCAALPYLAAAGVGRIDICDHDRVEAANLHRQVLFGPNDIGRCKADVAAEKCTAQNPFLDARPICDRFGSSGSFEEYDLILECTDNLATKFAANAIAVKEGKPIIIAGIYRFEGQLQVVLPGGPCLSCLWQEPPSDGCVGTCEEVGVLGAVPGVLGAMQATEALKLILGLTASNAPLVLVDLLSMETNHVKLQKRADCPVCGSGETIRPIELIPDRLEDYRIIDIREPWETEEDPISWPKLELMPLSKWAGFDPDGRPALFVCHAGIRTANLVRHLREEGLAATYSLPGGISTFKRLTSATH